jgi:hypothetical protein
MIVSPAGVTSTVDHISFQALSHGDLIHLTPRAPALEGDPSLLVDYQYFRLELVFPEAQAPRQHSVTLSTRPDTICSLKFLLPSPMVGALMGRGGTTVRNICVAYDCNIEVSPWGSFHPAATLAQCRTVQCFANNTKSLCQSMSQVIDTVFANDHEATYLKLILPTASISELASARLSEIQTLTGASLLLRAPDPVFRDEQFLECKGTPQAFVQALTHICSSLHFPLPYNFGTEYGPPASTAGNIAREPETSASRKRALQTIPLPRETKRSKPHSWRPNQGPGSRGRGRGHHS